MYQITNQFLSKEWIMEKWDAGFYITAAAGARLGPPACYKFHVQHHAEVLTADQVPPRIENRPS